MLIAPTLYNSDAKMHNNSSRWPERACKPRFSGFSAWLVGVFLSDSSSVFQHREFYKYFFLSFLFLILNII